MILDPKAPRDDDWLDDAFPLGDGVVETSSYVECPYCGAEVEVLLDPGGGAQQRYVEDCEVCCRPWTLHVTWNESGEATVAVFTEEEEP